MCVLAATVLLGACPSPAPPRVPTPPDDAPLRIRIARAEAQRGAGVAELVELASHGDRHARELALRGLGRIGGGDALAALRQALDDHDGAIVTAAMAAIGVASSLDEPASDQLGAISASLTAALPRAGDAAIAAEALGRAGDASVQPALVAQLAAKSPVVVEAAALALGRHGRRKIALAPASRAALIAATRRPEVAIRYAAVYALAREHVPAGEPTDPAAGAALAARVVDDDPEIRATAIGGLARRKDVTSGRKDVEDSLRDVDWRVAVEAVRLLAGPTGDDAGRTAVAAAVVRRWNELVRGNNAEAHVVIETLRTLADHAMGYPTVVAALTAVARAPAETVAPLSRGWGHCLATMGLVRVERGAFVDAIARCGGGDLPDHLRLPLLAELVTARAGDASERRAAMRVLLGHADARVRAAGLGALSATWDDGNAADHRALIATVAAALATPDPIIAGAAIDAAGALYDALDRTANTQAERAQLDAAVVSRATSEPEVELSSSLYELVGKHAIAAGAAACRAGLAAAQVRAHAAAECLRALGEVAAATTPAPPPAPPVDVASVIGKHVTWHLATSRGEIVIELRPDVAPWNVATIVALTRKGFYDNVELHRVVPDFVAQGGDPTMSGWGGPGFTTPAEPSIGSEATFAAGGIGMADAGRDSGGSQWFVMHSRAPHLEGRYTCVGAVVSGQKSADALLIGDRVVHATVEVR
jgi:cyclophilin family peptidyl-prolyl cis-trans isomerase